MSANIEKREDGRHSVFSVREPMWHGLGIIKDDYPGREEAMADAGHTFTLVESPVVPMPVMLENGTMIQATQADNFKALVRSDNAHTLAVVKISYTPIQPVVLWDAIDVIVDQPNVRYETAGTLGKGEVLWVLAKLDEPIWMEGGGRRDPSPIFPYVLVSSYNDGRGSFTGRTVLTRVVCQNTVKAAESESDASGRVFKFAHRGDVMARIEEAREVLKGTKAEMAAHISEMQDLLKLRIDEPKRELFLKRFVPEPSAADVISDRVRGNIDEARAQIRAILNSETCKDVEDTGYGLYQASVEFLDHVRRAHNKESAFRRTILEPKPFKARALKWIRELEKV